MNWAHCPIPIQNSEAEHLLHVHQGPSDGKSAQYSEVIYVNIDI
jgi:hypothetical protein